MTVQLDNYYTILDIEMGADTTAIEAAIKSSRKRWRQMQGSPNKEQARLAEQRMEQLAAASEVLLEPERRAQYDAALMQQLSAVATQLPAANTTNWGERAKEYYENGDVRNSFTAAKKGTDVDPENSQTWLYYVLSASDLKRMDDADFASAELVNRMPSVATSHDLRGGVLDRMERYHEAEISFRTAASLDATSAYYQGRAAWAVLDQGYIDKAVTEAKEIVARFPDDSYPLRVLRAATESLRLANRAQDAYTLGREVLAFAPDDADTLTSVIVSVETLSTSDIAGASSAAWSLLDAYPNAEDVQRVNRYVVLTMLEQSLYSDALTWARALVQRYPQNQDMKRVLARCLIGDAESKLATPAPNMSMIVNKAQAAYLNQAVTEAESLQVTDPQTQELIQKKRSFYAEQTRTRVRLGFWKIVLAIAAVVLVLFVGLPTLPGGLAAIVIGAALGWAFWVTSFPKQYRLNFRAASPEVRKSGLQK